MFREPLPAQLAEFDYKKWVERESIVRDMVARSLLEPIRRKYAGESFSYGTPREAALFLQELKGLGYVIPDYALEVLMQE